MKSPRHIPSYQTRTALETSPFKDSIYFVGYTDDKTRDWLYKNATTFVFPSIYEGFGLPVLEAMKQKVPIICYGCEAIREIAADIPFYAMDASTIIDRI